MAEVNIPLLRKAVEWAEAEAAKPEGGLWIQAYWVLPPNSPSRYLQNLRSRQGLDESCGTAYCIAGYICQVEGLDVGDNESYGAVAAQALGLTYCDDRVLMDAEQLFEASNTIEDVRRIAEDLAGERL